MGKRTCSVEGCDRAYSAKGWCNLHYQRWLTHGDPLWHPPTVEERFWAKVNKDGPVVYDHLGQCWVWTGALAAGYGSLGVTAYDTMHAHRLAWVLRFGEIPDGLWVLHHCDNRACVRTDPDPDVSHLYLGTHQDNVNDMWRRGRAYAAATLQPCDTYGAFQRHYRRGETPCEACVLAARAARRERTLREKP